MSRSTGPARPPRYEREIEQVLRRSRGGRRRWRLRLRMPRPRLPHLGWDRQTGVLLGWALVVAAFVLSRVSAPWATSTARWLLLGAIALVVVSYVAALFPRQPRYEKRWRGEVLDLRPPEPAWRQALRRLFRRR